MIIYILGVYVEHKNQLSQRSRDSYFRIFQASLIQVFLDIHSVKKTSSNLFQI